MNIEEALDVISKIDEAYKVRKETILYAHNHGISATKIAARFNMKLPNVSAIINSKPIEPS